MTDPAGTENLSFVDFQNVWLAYNEELLAQNHFAVEEINLQAKQGEFIAIVGPSGCGKSTFMKLATGLKMPSKGKILIDGKPVTGSIENIGDGVSSALFVALANNHEQCVAAIGNCRTLP